jgi:hypothetical protein
MALNFITVVSVVLGIPVVFLIYEYVSRPNETLYGAFQKSGPDFCLIGLGSSGSIFIDPQVTSSFQLAPQLCLIFAIAAILILRSLCYKVQVTPPRWQSAFASLGLGLGSIGLVFGILGYAYLYNK